MTFDNEFLKDLTERVSDYMDEEQLESDESTYVCLHSVDISKSKFNEYSHWGVSTVIALFSMMITRHLDKATYFGTWDVSEYLREDVLDKLGKLVYASCDLAHKLGCNDLTKYVRNAAQHGGVE